MTDLAALVPELELRQAALERPVILPLRREQRAVRLGVHLFREWVGGGWMFVGVYRCVIGLPRGPP